MGMKDSYKIDSLGDGTFAIKKFDEDLNFVETYYMSEVSTHSIICGCPAGGRPTCRHRKMLRIFQAEQKIDSGWFYHFDKDSWIEPLNAG